MQLSHAEENYIKVIYQLSNGGQQLVATTMLANALHMSPAAITDMIQRLHQKNLITYQKYQGVNLALSGKEEAMQILRRHRLWEVFLVKKLRFAWDEVEKVTEELEHIHSEHLIQRLDDYLGNPSHSPQGEPIPDKNGHIKTQPQMVLSQLEIGQTGIIVAVKDGSAPFLQYLSKKNIYLGAMVKVLEKITFDQSMEVSIDGGSSTSVSLKVSDNLLIVYQ
jgi:DtxR family Mn-dependent transcriptional regulator